MIFKSIVLLISVIWSVQSLDPYNQRNTPVHLRELKYVVIDGYHGRMDAKTMEVFDNVETLSMQNCNFTTLNENFIQPLKNLQKLILAYNHHEKLESDASECCEKLREIEVYETSVAPPVEKEEFNGLAAMKALERLYFFKANTPVIKANSLAGSNLKILEIEYGNLATIEEGALHGMDKLEVLNLQRNKLKSVPTSNLAALKTLKELNLRENLLEKITTADFPSLPNLVKLNLGHNPVKEIDLKGLKEKLPNIKEVDVSGIDIEPSNAEGVPLMKMQIL